MENKKERINSLDYLRSFAIICVVLCHATQSYFYVSNINVWHNFSIYSKLYMTISMTIARLGVPIFLMLTRNINSKKRFFN